MGLRDHPPAGLRRFGYKQSGFGREGGRAGIDEFLRSKSVYIAPTG